MGTTLKAFMLNIQLNVNWKTRCAKIGRYRMRLLTLRIR